MKLRDPRLLRVVGWLGGWLLRGWLGLVRRQVEHETVNAHPNVSGGRYIYAFWHETLFFATSFRTNIHVLISQHADGELIAQICRHLGYEVVRGSTSRGGARALRAMCEHGRQTHLFVTPDGPRGPRRRVQPGLIYIASRTGLPIVPCGVGYARAWRARSWDRFAVPWPFSRAVCLMAAPLTVPPDLDRDGLEHHRQRVEERLLAVTIEAERRANREVRAARRPPATAVTKRRAGV